MPETKDKPKEWVVERVKPEIYPDDGGGFKNGFRLYVTFIEFKEKHEFLLSSIDLETVTKVVEKLLAERKSLPSG